jgi:RHS repeat-associated protein
MYDIYDRPIAFNEKHGRTVTHSYSGNSTTITEDDVSTTKTYDVLGNMVSATDPAGTIRYKFHPDGQPISIVAPGNVTTSFGYDKYRRRTTLTDPSCGTTLYEYDAAGNVSKETNANNQTIINEYDSYSRLAKRSTPEFTTSYTYNANNELTRISSNNGTSKAFTYDGLGRIKSFRETAVDGKWLQKDYSYSNGNIRSIQYNSSYFLSVIEDYYYTNSYLTEVILDKQKSIYKLSEENSQGQSTKIITGNITREYSFDNRGLPTWFNAETARSVIQDFLYDYDAKSGNLFAWRNNRRNTTESFSYDNLNRLIEDSNNSVEYGANGNILSRSDIGTYEYGNSSKPYAVTGINFSKNGMPTGNQDITYTSFSRPKYIMENGYKAEFSYNGNYDRVKMDITHNDSSILTRYYLAGCYELQESPSADIIERLYLGGDYYSASTVYVMEAFYGEPYHIMRDPLGSIMHITDTEGNVVQELSYDAWGRLRNPANHKVYAPGLEPNLFLGRGYTGHEHLPLFGLINMNARLYDPVLGRFLSPDPYIQMPDFTQNFNRYSYCLNNPMRYNDKNGEFILGFISGFFRGLFQGKNPLKTGWQTGVNELKIYGGLFALDSRKNLLAKGWELVSRFTWQLPQTIIGLNYTQISNWAWQVDRVDYWGGATVSSGNNWGKGSGAAVTLGSYITGGSELKADPNNALFQHEYGHYLQSQEMGWAYLPRVGIPSVMSTFKNDRNHKYQPYEQDANRRAFLYFNKNVEGFYKTFDERNEKRGWDFYRNPLDVYHTASNDRYYDYYNPQHLALLNNLSLHAKWFDYTPMIIDIGIGNGIYYNNHRIK